MAFRRFLFPALLLIAISCGSNSPSAPSASPSPSPSPSPSAPVTLTGFVRETSPTDTVGIENARVEVFDVTTGILTGIFVVTDARGFYQFPGLTGRGLNGRVDLRASKEGYEGQSKVGQLATAQPTLDFNLMPLSRRPPRETLVVGQTHTGTISWSDPTCAGMYFILPCKRYAFTVSDAASFRLYLKWANLNDIDLELWREGTLVEASLTCQACGIGAAEELLRTRILPPGDYELRVTGYELRVETTSYELTATTPAG